MRHLRLIALSVWIVFGIVCLISWRAHAADHLVDANKVIPPGLEKVMAEGAGRVANMTCADVSDFVALYGARRAEAVARAAGATDSQIQEGKRCLKSSSR